MKGIIFTQKVARRRKRNLKANPKVVWPERIGVDGISIVCGTCNKQIVNKQESIRDAQVAAMKTGAVIIEKYVDIDGVAYHCRNHVRNGQTGFVRREDVEYHARKHK